MASNRASTSRLSLEDWDLLSPLSPNEIASVQRVNQAARLKPIPLHLQSTEKVSIDSSPTSRSTSLPLSRTPPPLTTSTNGPITSMQQFHDWFSSVEQSIEHSQERVFREYLLQLCQHLTTCETILEGLDTSRGLLSEMEANFNYVEENSKSLQFACESMLSQEKHLWKVTESLGQRLEYFRELELSTKMLNLPGQELVLKEDFLNMIDRLDVCLDYLKQNRDFRDSEIYLIRFQQCLTRAMTLIKMYFVSTVRKLTLDTSDKLFNRQDTTSSNDLSETALNALLYQKFEKPSQSLRILLIELEKRAELDPEEYSSLRSECFSIWFQSRSTLLSPGLAEEVKRMEPKDSELIKLAKMGCNHLRSVCLQEWELYKQYFSTGENELYEFLENLCDHLYDSLRPRILSEPHLEVLCELCTVLGAMMALDADTGLVEAMNEDSDEEAQDLDDDEEQDQDEDLFSSPSSPLGIGMMARQSSNQTITRTTRQRPRRSRQRLGRLKFSILLNTILQDTQTRLVFRAQSVIQTQVLHYQPTSKDLDYPQILQDKASSSGKEPLWKLDDAGDDEDGGDVVDKEKKFRVPNESQMKWWYPTLRRTVWVLARLNAFVNTAIFEDFAGEAVTLCQQSLLSAAEQISSTSSGSSSSKLDGQLFLVRHLLLLKETVRSVDLVHIERAADFSSVTEMLNNILRNTSAIFTRPTTLFQYARGGIPNFNETMFDSKTELDSCLKQTCQNLIESTSLELTKTITNFLDRCTKFLSTPITTTVNTSSTSQQGKGDLSSQEWSTPEQVLKLHQDFQDCLIQDVKRVGDKMRLYLEEEKTVKVLLPPLLDEIVETYTTFFNLTRSEYGFATSSSLLPPSDVKEKLKRVTEV